MICVNISPMKILHFFNISFSKLSLFFRFKANSRKVKFVVSSLPSDEAFPVKFTDFQVTDPLPPPPPSPNVGLPALLGPLLKLAA
jgi:hypothetical protein